MQTRALQTYVKRVYYPFLLRDPEIHALEDGTLCALWVHTHPTLAGMPQARNSLSAALVVPALSALPAALGNVEDLIAGSGARAPWLGLPFRVWVQDCPARWPASRTSSPGQVCALPLGSLLGFQGSMKECLPRA